MDDKEADRLRDLAEQYLADVLGPEERAKFEQILLQDDRAVAEIMAAARRDLALHEALKAAAPSSEAAPKPATRRAVRRPDHLPASRSVSTWIAAAAAILVAAIVLFSASGPSAPDPAGTARKPAPKPKEVHAPQEPKPREKPEPGVLVQPLPENGTAKKPAPTPEDLRRERERIEQELRDAARPRTAPERPQDPPKPAPAPTPVPPPEKKIEATATELATLEKVDGEVILVRASGRQPAQAGQALLPGDGVITPKTKGGVVVKHADGTRLDVGFDTELKDLAWEGGKRVIILRGELRAVIAKQPIDQPMIFATPHGEAKVLGTTLRLLVDKETRLDVEEGKVRMSSLAGKTVDVASGHFTVAAVGGDLVSRPIPSGTVYSPVRYVGDLANWEVFPPEVWKAVSRDGDVRFFKKPSLEPIELAKLKDRTYGDFTLTFKAKTIPFNGGNIPNGYTILFGMQGDSTWAVLAMTSQAETTRLETRMGGRGKVFTSPSKPGCPDFSRYHAVTLVRKKDTVTVTVNGELILTATDRDLVGVGQIGLGAGGASFDDIVIE